MSKTIAELESMACLYWPRNLSDIIAEMSSIPILLKTQDQFLSILKSSDKTPESWATTLNSASTLTANIFLKHLMVLTDIGGERLQRIARDFKLIFPDNKMEYIWNSIEYSYDFSATKKTWTNKALYVEKSVLLKNIDLTQDMKDAVMILMWASNIINNDNIPQELIEKCVIGNLLGKPKELDKFVAQRYIYVSKITGGSISNDLGHACEHYVNEYLAHHLPKEFTIGGHNIEGISHNENNLTTFDLVVRTHQGMCFAIEISFQVTTNSVIERKSSLAQSRKKLLNQNGHKMIYIIDGSGNFQRRNAINTILNYSDLCVNFSDLGLSELVNYIISEAK